MSATLEHFSYSLDLIKVLIAKELKVRYRGTVLGFLCSLANPLAFSLVLYVAFKQVFRIDIENYPLFILSALFPYQWFSNSTNAASTLFFVNAHLIKKLRFPRYALCVAVVSGDMLHFLVTIPILVSLAFILQGEIPGFVQLIGIPILLVTQASLTLGVVIAIATLNAFFRDLEQFVRVLLLLLLYVTTILFPIDLVPENLTWMLIVNPLAPLFIAWRALFVENVLNPLVLAVANAFLVLLIALPVYRKLGWRLPELV